MADEKKKTPASEDEKDPKRVDTAELDEELDDVSGGSLSNHNCGC
jgi:hypothetical protein